MITLYAIFATFFLGAFVRHNFPEVLAAYKAHKFLKKIDARIAKNKEEAVKVGENPFIPPQG